MSGIKATMKTKEHPERCPFCGEDGFDLIGLRGHLLEYCDAYRNIPTPQEDYLRARSEQS